MRERASGYGSCEVMRLRSSGGRESKGDVMLVVVVVVVVARNSGAVVLDVVVGFDIGCGCRLGWNAK